jgi:hypothetical protein
MTTIVAGYIVGPGRGRGRAIAVQADPAQPDGLKMRSLM